MLEWLRNIDGDRRQGFTAMIDRFRQMLADGQHVFDRATDALLGTISVEETRDEIFQTDRRINRAEQEIRRRLIVHVAAHGDVDFPACLVLMSIAKDAERIGDYGKNVFDLAAAGSVDPELGAGAGIAEVKERVSQLLSRMSEVYESQDEAGARAVIRDAESIEDACDGRIELLVGATEPIDGVLEALAYRYLKRIASHARNIVTSVIMPMDKLDYFDER